jgi:multicomponent K+:H+ antiporter subunit E
MTRPATRISPTAIVVLAGLWLLLNQSVDPRTIAMGLILSLPLAWFGSTLRPLRARLRRPDVALGLLLVVARDILHSNFEVARIVLGLARHGTIRSGFLRVPLDLRDPHGLAALAIIVTSTPGTVWVGLSPDGGTLTLHVLHLGDEEAWIRTIKNRYERPLMRIFQ